MKETEDDGCWGLKKEGLGLPKTKYDDKHRKINEERRDNGEARRENKPSTKGMA